MTSYNRPEGHRLRKGRASEPGRIYLVTAVTRDREPVFNDFSSARVAARAFHDSVLAGEAETLAFVVMPDHVHWLLQLSEQGDLSRTVRLYKAKVSARLCRRVWQRGYHDHALRQEESLRAAARYLVANPLRAGLAERVGDYPFWDAVWLGEAPGGYALAGGARLL